MVRSESESPPNLRIIFALDSNSDLSPHSKYIQKEKVKNLETMSTPIRRSSRLQRLSLSRGEENQDVPIIITKNKSVRKPKKVLTNVVNTITEVRWNTFKGSPDQSHFIFEINVGKSRIRHRTTLKLNNVISF